MKNIVRLLRYDLPLHFVWLLTNWLPDMVVILRLRGWLMRPFFRSCGKNFRVGRNVTFYNPKNIIIGSDVYIAYGNWFSAGAIIAIEDKVIIGPYCIFSSSNHTKKDGSFRYGKSIKKPIYVSEGVWIAGQCSILSGAVIGHGSLVAANSVVNRKIDTGVLCGGSPAKIIKKL
jgi:acetyltransferase-like isoleucine patch superfamily enzyme